MSPQFLLKLFFNVAVSCSSVQTAVPGILESLETLIKGHRDQFKNYRRDLSKKMEFIDNFSEIESLYIDGLFMKSLMLHSDDEYIHLAKDNSCMFYSLIENNLLKNSEGDIQEIIINVKFRNSEELHTRYTSKNTFLKYIHSGICFTNREITKLFTSANIKETLETLEYPIPSGPYECENILKEWRENKYTPYLCGVSKKIQDGHSAKILTESVEKMSLRQRRKLKEKISVKDRYSDKVDFFKTNYLKNLCKGILDSERFCQKYIAKDVWTGVLNRDSPQYKMSFKCGNYLNKENVMAQDLVFCSKKFKERPEVCTTETANNRPSLFPRPDCNTISKALNVSRLKTRYHDCPGLIDNVGITNIHRIIRHIDNKVDLSKPEECIFQVHSSFIDFNTQVQNQEKWSMKICYKERVVGEQRCFPYIPGYHSNNTMAENSVLSLALRYLVGMSSQEKCQFIEEGDFNPILLEYQTGCYVLFNRRHCTALNCPKRIFYNNKEVQKIEYKGTPTFSYFPNPLGNPLVALSNLVDKVYKKKSRTVQNFTELKSFLENKDHIIHGVGCLEDILPKFFKKVSMNQCRPMPFIVDGYIQDSRLFLVSIRTAIDDVHSPRIIKWENLYHAVSTYQSIHPLKSWTMNVIR